MVWAVMEASALAMPIVCVRGGGSEKGQADMTRIISVMESNQISKRN